MPIATHIIKIKGIFDQTIWKNEKEIKDYVKNKIENEISPSFHTDLELFKIDGNKIDIWVYIHAFPSEITRDIINKWIQDHIKEEGFSVIDFKFEMLFDMTNKERQNKFNVLLK